VEEPVDFSVIFALCFHPALAAIHQIVRAADGGTGKAEYTGGNTALTSNKNENNRNNRRNRQRQIDRGQSA
jgi:hypothetical protein